MTPETISAGAAVLTMVAAVAAMVVAWRAPKMAAQFAENLRRQNEAETERTRLRMMILIVPRFGGHTGLAGHALFGLLGC